MNLKDEFLVQFRSEPALWRLLSLNTLVFLVVAVARLILFLSGDAFSINAIVSVLSLKSDPAAFVVSPWGLLTYMFVHEQLLHFLFNMLVLYWTGRIFTEFLGGVKLVSVYLLGGLAGGLLYMGAYNLFPAFSNSVNVSQLIGASAGVFAVLVGVATLAPDYTVHLILFGPVRIKFIALFLVVMYLISIPLDNAGGNISHLGGALIGFIYIKALRSGTNIGSWLDKISVTLVSLIKGRSSMRVVKGGRQKQGKTVPRQEIIDAILDKISKSGYSSLSKEEKETLFRASKDKE